MYQRDEIEGAFKLPSGTIIVPDYNPEIARTTESIAKVIQSHIKKLSGQDVSLETIVESIESLREGSHK